MLLSLLNFFNFLLEMGGGVGAVRGHKYVLDPTLTHFSPSR